MSTNLRMARPSVQMMTSNQNQRRISASLKSTATATLAFTSFVATDSVCEENDDDSDDLPPFI